MNTSFEPGSSQESGTIKGTEISEKQRDFNIRVFENDGTWDDEAYANSLIEQLQSKLQQGDLVISSYPLYVKLKAAVGAFEFLVEKSDEALNDLDLEKIGQELASDNELHDLFKLSLKIKNNYKQVIEANKKRFGREKAMVDAKKRVATVQKDLSAKYFALMKKYEMTGESVPYSLQNMEDMIAEYEQSDQKDSNDLLALFKGLDSFLPFDQNEFETFFKLHEHDRRYNVYRKYVDRARNILTIYKEAQQDLRTIEHDTGISLDSKKKTGIEIDPATLRKYAKIKYE